MIVKKKKQFIWGLALAASFGVILVLMFSPIFHGENSLQAADRLFNSIAKGSTNYFPGLLEKNERYKDSKFEVTLKLADEDMAGKAGKLLVTAGVESAVDGAEVKATGYLGQMVEAALLDSQAMFNNQEEAILQSTDIQEKKCFMFGGLPSKAWIKNSRNKRCLRKPLSLPMW